MIRIEKTRNRALKEFVIEDGRKVVLRQPQRRDAMKLLVFINGLVNEKKRSQNSQLHTGFESVLTLKQEREWLEELLTQIRKGNIISVLAEIDGNIVGNGEIVRVNTRRQSITVD